MMLISRDSSLLRFFALICLGASLSLLSSCGVKGPPLPPISATPEQPQVKSLGREPTPIKPIPSASPVPSSAPRKGFGGD